MVSTALLEKKLNLKSMTLLIVDGNDFSRTFTRNICRSFNFADILITSNSKDALDHLCSTEIDMMVTDWALKPDWGDVFVRKVRTMPGVRNPYLPIIVLTAMSDRETAAAALNAGTNEFMTRPFELRQLLARFAQVLLNPRPFIRCASYVGPERRRQQREFEGPDRRAGSNTKQMRPPSVSATVAKVGRPGGLTIGAMEKAGAKVIVEEEVRYRDVRRQDLDDLGGLFDRLRQAAAPDQEIVEQIYLKSHALKGMGQTFGFPLLTDAGDSLCRMLWKLSPERSVAPLTLQGVEAHIRTMRLIVEQDIRHDGGAVGAELISGLRTLVERVAAEGASRPA